MLGTLAKVYFRVLDAIVVICLGGMVVMVFGNVLLRYGFNAGITQSEELSRWLFVWMVFCGAVVVFREGGHIALDVLVKLLPAIAQRVVLALTTLIMVGITLLIIQGSLVQVRVNITSFAPASGLSLSWFFASGLVFGLSVLLVLIHRLMLIARNQPLPETRADMHE
jgi:TRAP-type C4-dicarboxylate transport system permease small subunit